MKHKTIVALLTFSAFCGSMNIMTNATDNTSAMKKFFENACGREHIDLFINECDNNYTNDCKILNDFYQQYNAYEDERLRLKYESTPESENVVCRLIQSIFPPQSSISFMTMCLTNSHSERQLRQFDRALARQLEITNGLVKSEKEHIVSSSYGRFRNH
jgi:hypothetical protein